MWIRKRICEWLRMGRCAMVHEKKNAERERERHTLTNHIKIKRKVLNESKKKVPENTDIPHPKMQDDEQKK